MNILISFNHSVAFDRRAFIGAATLANARGDVRLVERLSNVSWSEVVQRTRIDGLIVSRAYDSSQSTLNQLGIPFVSIADVAELASNEYVVANDERAIGLAAARQFLDAGYRHFAVCCRPGICRTFANRIDSFVEAARDATGAVIPIGPTPSCPGGPADDFEDETTWADDAAGWIASLPRPLAVFAPYDYHARVAVNAALQAGLRVPDDVGVIGVDDDDVYCMTTFPQLSSVVTAARQVGQAALTTLIRAIRGDPATPRRTLIAPPGVMVRGSSSDSAIDDPDVLAAIRFIRDNVARGVTVGQVADQVLLSRRTLERRFVTLLSRTIQDEMRRAKVARAKRLLIDTDLPYADVAKRSGFAQQQQLSRSMKLATGQTPAQIRRLGRSPDTA